MTRTTRTERIEELNVRIEAYKARELEMLRGGVMSYGIGSRNITRYNTDLKAIKDTIKELEEERDALLAAEDGIRPRKAVAVVPRDW